MCTFWPLRYWAQQWIANDEEMTSYIFEWTSSSPPLTSKYWHQTYYHIVLVLFPERQLCKARPNKRLFHTWVTQWWSQVLPGLPAALLFMSIDLETKLTTGHHVGDWVNTPPAPYTHIEIRVDIMYLRRQRWTSWFAQNTPPLLISTFLKQLNYCTKSHRCDGIDSCHMCVYLQFS